MTGGVSIPCSSGLLKNRPIPSTPSHSIRVLSLAVPALVEIEPPGQHQVGLFGEAVPVGVGENEFALVVQEDLQGAVVDVAVATDTDPEYIMSQSWTSLRIGDEMMEVEPDFVGATRSRAAPTFSSQDLSFLSFGGVSVAGIEADALVLDG